MQGRVGRGAQRADRRLAGGLEIFLLSALAILLGVAAWKFFRLLDRVSVSWERGLPVGLLFAAAGAVTIRRLVRRLRLLRLEEADDVTGFKSR